MESEKDTITLSTDDSTKRTGEVLASEVMKGHVNAALLLSNLLRGVYGETAGLGDWQSGLVQTTKVVKSGDLSDIEGMLVGQAYALDALFLHLIRRSQDTNLMPQLETFIRLALKAQNQSRATAQTLATLKNPQQTVFLKQANIAHGPQQVNNNIVPQYQQPRIDDHGNSASSLKNFKTEQNELLNAHEEIDRLDTGAAGKAVSNDPAMDAVGAVNGAKNRGRKGSSGAKCL